MAEFCMPSLGADMENGKLVEWLVAPGAMVKRGDIIAVVETQKGSFEIESFEDGILGEPLVAAGATVPVGTVLAHIRTAHDEQTVIKRPSTEAASEQSAPATATSEPDRLQMPTGERQAVSPSARRLAAELGVDLATVVGTGPHGVIQRVDIETAAHRQVEQQRNEPPTTSPAPAGLAMPAIRQAIAAAMSRSNREIPHYYLETEIDLSRALQWLEDENGRRPLRERVLPAVVLLKAVAGALRQVPELNGYWVDDQLQVKSAIHIGFAIALRQGGLIAPALLDVDQQPLDMLMRAMADLIDRARSGRLRGSEMTEATVSVTNLGDRGVRTVFGVIYPPQVALIGLGRVTERPWAENGMLGARRCVTATLSADHRATDGHQGALFLEALDRYLQQPEKL
jgi:pyruvate dehydrogenase E2 component (dihydrolipoamide acetyltransferase)